MAGGLPLGAVGRLGEQPAQIAVVEVRVLVAVVRALAVVVLPQRLLQAGQRRQLAARHPAGRMPGELLHELVHVLELLQRRPVVVALAPLRVRVEPHRERLGEVLVGMALRVPGIEVQHEALAVRLRRVVLGILGRRRPEQLEPLAAALQLVGVVDGVAGLVAEDLDAPVVRAALHLEHLALLELLEPGMREIERDGDAADAVRREPLVRQPVVGLEREFAVLELGVQLRDARHQLAAFDGDAQVAHPDVEQLLVVQRRPPVGRAAGDDRGRVGEGRGIGGSGGCAGLLAAGRGSDSTSPHQSAATLPAATFLAAASTWTGIFLR